MGHSPMHQGETLPRRCLLDAVPILWTKDIPTTLLRTTMAGLWRLVIDLVLIVVREFLACLNIPDGYNPDGIPKLFRVAVGFTRMIDKACRILGCTAIDGIPLVQSEDIGIASG